MSRDIIEYVFDEWCSVPDQATLVPVDRMVAVDVGRLFPPGTVRRDRLPLWLRAGGLVLEPTMPARQVAWLRRCDGSWIAAVDLPASSANGRSHLVMRLWLPPAGFAVSSV